MDRLGSGIVAGGNQVWKSTEELPNISLLCIYVDHVSLYVHIVFISEFIIMHLLYIILTNIKILKF